MEAIAKKGNAIRGSENLSLEEMQQEFIMLALRSKGLNLTELKKMYGNEWISNNRDYLYKLDEGGYIIRSDNFIKFTKAGYLLCDEILLKFQ